MGKATMKSFFKSKSQKESNVLTLQASIEIADQEILDFKKLINFLTIYHGQVAIPKFKVAKSKMYLKMLNNFCVKEISNAHLTATLFHSLLELGNKEWLMALIIWKYLIIILSITLIYYLVFFCIKNI